jgi:hypothetical protein
MENNTLLGATTDSVVTYDGSGVFNPNNPYSDVDPNYNPAPTPKETKDEPDESRKPEENTDTSTNTLLMYGGAALLLYYFFFKKK